MSSEKLQTTSPVEIPGNWEDATKETKETISLTSIHQNDDGSVSLEFDMSDGFKKAFKEYYGLKRWSQKKFNEWVDENLIEFLKTESD